MTVLKSKLQSRYDVLSLTDAEAVYTVDTHSWSKIRLSKGGGQNGHPCNMAQIDTGSKARWLVWLLFKAVRGDFKLKPPCQTADFHNTTQIVTDNFTFDSSFTFNSEQFVRCWKRVKTVCICVWFPTWAVKSTVELWRTTSCIIKNYT